MNGKGTRALLALILCAALLLCAVPAAAGAELRRASAPAEMAEALYALGLFRGKGSKADGSPDFALDDPASRNEAATMLIRLMGRESKAQAQYASGAIVCPFTDAGWAAANVTWLYEAGCINGTGPTTFAGAAPVDAQQFAAMTLRALGYTEAKGDYTWAGVLDFAVRVGLLTESRRAALSAEFRRAGMVEICYNALGLRMRDSSLTLLEKLTNDGVFKASYDTALSDTKPLTLRPLYTGGGSTSRWDVEEPASADPVCADVDGDGRPEIIFAVRSLYCLDAATGKIKWSVPSGHEISEKASADAVFGAAVQSPQVLDVDGDGRSEIVSFFTNYPKDQTFVGVYDGAGNFRAHWLTPHAVRAVELDDFDGDGRYELALGYGFGDAGEPAVGIYSWDGSLLPGWPQKCGFGLFSNSMEAVDLDGDGRKELVALFDEDQIAAFHLDGTPVYATGGAYAGLAWRGLPVAESYEFELKLAEWARNHGGAASGQDDAIQGPTREGRNINTGTYGGVAAADVDGDGKTELVFTSMILDGSLVMRNGANTYEGIARYFTTFILNTDRTRYVNPTLGYDWTQMPTDVGEIVSLGTADLPHPDLRPTVADVDGDGRKEILFSSFDGKLHCFHLDGTEHGAWPYALDLRTSAVQSFASRPCVADVNGDGRPEVVFTTYTPMDQTAVRGRLVVLDCTGRLLGEITLPVWWGWDGPSDVHYADGSRAMPCVADVNGDGKPEIIVTTLTCGVCVYTVS